jgi:hypothetical protein
MNSEISIISIISIMVLIVNPLVGELLPVIAYNQYPNQKQQRMGNQGATFNLHSLTPIISPPSTLSLSPSERPSDVAPPSQSEQQSTVQRLFTASAIAAASDPTNFNSKMDKQQQSCLESSSMDNFILPLKEVRFTHIRPCVTVTGTMMSGLKVNADGDISFNIAVDPPYAGMLGPGNLDVSHTTLSGKHGLHIEVICQEPVISIKPMDVGACNGYNGPDFHSSLPNGHEHVMVTGRFQIEWSEAPGGLTEIHPVYEIKPILSN